MNAADSRCKGDALDLVGNSPVIRELRREVDALARIRSTALLIGETGVGKGLVARMLHERSDRPQEPFVHVDCASLAGSIIESELFGHERGSFTGAVGRRAGRFEQAGAGTIFLDEIGELEPPLQAKLLRILHDRTYERIGGSKTLTMNARVVAATNRDLAEEVRKGFFRSDLYFRLRVFELKIPPLRERLSDVPLLVRHAVAELCDRLSLAPPVYLLLATSILLVAVMVLIPAWSTTRRVTPRLLVSGTVYFLLIGAGFMFIEMSLLQLWSVFLGHPIYSLSVVLFSLILSTGLGSLLIDRLPIRNAVTFFAIFLFLTVYLFAIPFWLPEILLRYNHVDLFSRAALCIGVTAPAGFVMGFALPTGMSLAAAQDYRPTPWFWGINGAAAVAAATLSIAVSLTFDIYAALKLGAACYLMLIASAIGIGFKTKSQL